MNEKSSMMYNQQSQIFSYLTIFIMIAMIASSCEKESEGAKYAYNNFVPSHFPMPDLHLDSLPSEAKILLGKKLFYDPILSIDSTISCASCHKSEFAFADNVAFSNGVFMRPGTRNSPSLANVVYQKKLLREGGVPTLEMQILVPIQEHNEFNSNIIEISEKLKRNKTYRELADLAFGREIDPFVITRSIAAFERILISGNSRYDQFLNGKTSLSPTELYGKELFFSSKTNCSSCHGSFLFTNQTYENNGLYELYNDIGRKRLTDLDEDEAHFKVPSLRNVGLTAPYMHDGSISSLDEVIDHYNSGGRLHKNKSKLVQPLNLTIDDKKALLAFLSTLTDDTFIKNKYFKND